MSFWNFKLIQATDKEPESAELRIDGDIVDDNDAWIYEWFGDKCTTPNAFRAELKKVTGKPLAVWIDSYGGSVFAAAGIYNALMEHKGGVTVKIDGKAMSAATVIAMAGDKILMSPASLMMIHNPLTEVYGYASDLRKVADVLDQVKESIMNAYEIKTGRTRDDISAMMDAETYMSAGKAVDEKFADEVLFTESATPVKMKFGGNRVSNCDNEAMKRMVALYKPTEPPDNTAVLKAKLALECEL